MQTKNNKNAARDAVQVLTEYSNNKRRIDTALDQSGIGHDFADVLNKQTEEISKFCADLQSRCIRQALYNLTNNVPCGVLSRFEATSEHAIKRALAGACGALVHWDITGALNLAADIAQDVNAHGEAELIRKMAYQDSGVAV